MRRAALAFAAGLVAVAAGRADIPSPPQPGKRFLPLQHRVTTPVDHPDYDFYANTGAFPREVAFGAKAPALLHGTEFRRGQFVAVPKAARAGYKSDQEYRSALLVGTVPGQVASPVFELRQEVPLADKRPGLVYSYTLVKLDKGGMVLKKSDKAPEVAAPPAPPVEGVPDAPAPPGFAPPGGAAVSGLAAALALAFAGVWLARRARV